MPEGPLPCRHAGTRSPEDRGAWSHFCRRVAVGDGKQWKSMLRNRALLPVSTKTVEVPQLLVVESSYEACGDCCRMFMFVFVCFCISSRKPLGPTPLMGMDEIC